MASQGLKRSLPSEENESQSSRPRKRPGGASRLSNLDKEEAKNTLLKRQQEREQEAKKAAATRGVHDVVRQHYNAVPQRGRDWRKTESRIKGLRSFNNWVKSTIIHKFSPDGSDESEKMLRVLDLGCGKGGDLGKWQQAPQPVELLVGIDPAEVSIDQARERYMQIRGRGGRGNRGSSRTFDAEFFAQDAFGQTIGNIPIIRHVGYDAPNSRRGGGFDVVSMMFCMHYAFESESKTRGMLQNVSGSLKKGGRFIGAIPSSDVIRAKVQAFHRGEQTLQSQAGKIGVLPTPAAACVEDRISESAEDLKSNSAPEASSMAPDSKPNIAQETIQKVTNDATNHAGAKDINLASIQDTKLTPTEDKKSEIAEHTKPKTAEDPKSEPVHGSKPKNLQEENTVNVQDSKTVAAQETKVISTQSTNPTISEVAEWGNSIYRVRFSGPTPKDGMFRPPFGWKYSYFMEEAVEEIPEYVVPWEAFRA
jgi:mRNA (guanine-N7-)-methyltransferase